MKYLKFITLTVFVFIIFLIIGLYFRDNGIWHIASLIQKLRGTSHYEGETKVSESMLILTQFIMPIIFLLSGIISYYLICFRLKNKR